MTNPGNNEGKKAKSNRFTGFSRKKSDQYEFVRASFRQCGYWRRRPYTRDFPSLAQRRVQYAAAHAARSAAGETGLRKYRNKEVPPAMLRVAEVLRGKKFATPKPRSVPLILKELTETLEQIGRNVSSFKALNRDVVPQLVLWQLEEDKRKNRREKKLRKNETATISKEKRA